MMHTLYGLQMDSIFSSAAPVSDSKMRHRTIPPPYGELFVMDADGSKQRPLTDNQWEDATPA